MMKSLELPLSYIIAFAIMGQIAGIFAIKLWGRNSDKFSNKTIIRIAAPLYILCILSWPFAAMAPSFLFTVLIVAFINILSGISTSGINLSLTNIGLKLAPKNESIVYLSAKNMVVAFFAALGPIAGGFLSDYFMNRSFMWNIEWNGPNGTSIVHLLELRNLSFLFIIGGILAFIALKTLSFINEEGEVSKDQAVAEMKTTLKKEFKSRLKKEAVLSMLYSPIYFHNLIHKKIKSNIGSKLIKLRNTGIF
jgi:MFS family permease